MTIKTYLLCFLVAAVFDNIVDGEDGIPQISLQALSGWSLQDGPIQIAVVTEGSADNITATCTVDFGDQSEVQSVNWSRSLSFSHTYSLGTYNATVVCSNSVNQVTAFHVTNVVSTDVPIKGMTATIPSYIQTGKPFEIKLSVTLGTNVLYRVIPGSNKAVWVLTTGLDTSKSQMYTLNTPGKVTVVVTATNEVSFAQSRPKAEVIRPVTGFRLTTRRSIVSFTDLVTFTLHTPGEQYFSMGPLRIEIFDNKTTIVNKDYISVTPSSQIEVLTRNLTVGQHNITARLSSPLDEQDAWVTVTAIEPITEYNASEVEFELDSVYPMNSSESSSNITITVITPVGGAFANPPVGIEITWDFGDGSPLETEFITSWEKDHTYTSRGNYTINLFTRLTGSEDIYNVSYPIRIGVLDVNVWPLQGIVDKTLFTIAITGAWGNDVNYLVDFGNDKHVLLNKTSVFEENITETETTFSQPGVYVIHVTVWSEHIVENIIVNDLIFVYLPVINYNVTWPRQIVSRLPVLLTISVTFREPLPTNATCDILFGDGENDTVQVVKPEVYPTTETTWETSTYTVESSTSTNHTSVTPDTSTTSIDASVPMEFNHTNESPQDRATESTTEVSSVQSSTSRVLPQLVSVFLVHNYTRFSSYALVASCYNDVSNLTSNWNVVIAANGVVARVSSSFMGTLLLMAFLIS